MKKEIFSTNQS